MEQNNNIYKQHAVNQWTENPIGSESTKYSEGTKEFFDEIVKNRYEVYAPWMKETFKFEQYKDKKVLEIGVGTGSDHLQFAKAGAILTGIDITPKSIELTNRNLELHGYHSNLLVADAENLPFEDNMFDVVYSFGVLHHIPDTQKVVNEIYRVLNPGGKAVIALYHKYSLFWIFVILYEMILRGGFLRKTIKQRLSEIEMGGKETKPLVKLYTGRSAKVLFRKFNKIKIHTRHIGIGLSGRLINKILQTKVMNNFLELLSLKFGWYLIIEAEKWKTTF